MIGEQILLSHPVKADKMIGKNILHYRIIEKLGEGGMGIVYLAEDTKLKRRVAIKFLPHHISDNSDERKRFGIEAQAAAALNHPNISHIYAIEEVDNEMFIVMEYIEGHELKQTVGAYHDTPMPINDAIDYALQIAEGLKAAHDKGIVHRDIKSSNIMITDDGKIKVMDFGLAKVGTGIQLTKEHSTLGTAPYMSPEQIQGNNVDQRSDIWSFGVVLYEMLTGRLPFEGDYEQAVLYSIMNEEFQSLSSFRSDIPEQLNNIVAKALKKNPQERYQSAQEFIDDLKGNTLSSSNSQVSAGYSNKDIPFMQRNHSFKMSAIVATIVILLIFVGYIIFGSKSETIDTLAILPFVNASNDNDTEYLCDGVTVNLINRLAEFSDLKVMSRYSVARFKDESANPLDAGRLMAVKSVLTGQLNIRGDKLIVDVELLKVDDGQQLWGDRFERDKKDILTIEHDIVNRISDKLEIKLVGNKKSLGNKDLTLDPMAYDLYLRGRYIMLGTSDDGPVRAQEFFRQAIEREPRLAIAYAGLGESYVTQAWLNSRDRDEMVPLAKAALKKAIELDAGLSEAYVLAGEIALYFDWDWAAAEKGYRKALELNPGSDLAHREYSTYLLALGQVNQAIEEAKIAQSLDPLSVYATHQLGYNFMVARNFSEAALEFRKAVELNPTWIWGNIKMGMSYSLMGDTAKAKMALDRADELLAGELPSPLAQSWLAQIAYFCGDTVRINTTIARLQNQSEFTYTDPIALADIFYRLGNYDKMFEYLEQGFEARSSRMPGMLIWGLLRTEIKDDPRYLDLLKRLNFPN